MTGQVAATGTIWGLIAGRHALPVSGYVIEDEVSADPREAGNWQLLVAEGMARLMAEPGPHNIIVTGLTPVAMMAVAWVMRGAAIPVNASPRADRSVTFLSYDRLTEDYLPVLTVGGGYEPLDTGCDWMFFSSARTVAPHADEKFAAAAFYEGGE